MKPLEYRLAANGTFPNNVLPALHYKKVLRLPSFFKGNAVKKILKEHGWTNNWRAGIFTYHHYHSNTHEVIAVIKGHATILLGGENGRSVVLQQGDVLVIPAGVAHKNLGKENDITCIGGYPFGVEYDIKYGEPGERPDIDKRIAAVPLPAADPVTGKDNPLLGIWDSINKKKEK